MKIQVRDEKSKPLGAIKIDVVDLDVKEAAKVKAKAPAWQRFLEFVLLKILDPSATASQENQVKKKTEDPKPAPKAEGNVKTVEIRISLPAFTGWSGFKTPTNRLRHASRRTLSAIVLALILIIVSAVSLISHQSTPSTAAAAASVKSKRPVLPRGTPKYATVLPAGKTIAQLGGWARVSPTNRDPVYAYADNIGVVRIDVSEQPLPASFIGDPDSQIAKMAKNFNANQKISLDNTTVYIATSSDGTQYLIFTKKNLLILISSNAPLTNNQWAAYINSLN